MSHPLRELAPSHNQERALPGVNRKASAYSTLFRTPELPVQKRREFDPDALI